MLIGGSGPGAKTELVPQGQRSSLTVLGRVVSVGTDFQRGQRRSP